jgi:hypothetical protein
MAWTRGDRRRTIPRFRFGMVTYPLSLSFHPAFYFCAVDALQAAFRAMFQIKLAADLLAAGSPKPCSQLRAPQEHQEIFGQGPPVALLHQEACGPMAHHLKQQGTSILLPGD